MDTESKNVARFLEALQISRERLIEVLYNQLILKGASSATPFLILSRHPFRIHATDSIREFFGSVALGIRAKPKIGEAIDFGVDILWDENGWLIMTEIHVDCDEGQKLLRSCPNLRQFRIIADRFACVCLNHYTDKRRKRQPKTV